MIYKLEGLKVTRLGSQISSMQEKKDGSYIHYNACKCPEQQSMLIRYIMFYKLSPFYTRSSSAHIVHRSCSYFLSDEVWSIYLFSFTFIVS